MNTRTILFFIFFLLACQVPARAEQGLCVRAVDGDTVRVKVDGREVAVRLLGVDAPEKRQEWGQEAAAFAREWCEKAGDMELELDRQAHDRYGRTLAYVRFNGAMLNMELVRAGLAVPYPYKPNIAHAQEFEAAQAEAQAAGVGFWSQGGLAESPAQWRKSTRRP